MWTYKNNVNYFDFWIINIGNLITFWKNKSEKNKLKFIIPDNELDTHVDCNINNLLHNNKKLIWIKDMDNV